MPIYPVCSLAPAFQLMLHEKSKRVWCQKSLPLSEHDHPLLQKAKALRLTKHQSTITVDTKEALMSEVTAGVSKQQLDYIITT